MKKQETKDIKSFLRHEILGCLTLINFFVTEEKPLDQHDKKEVTSLIKLASLLISHEWLFLNEFPRLFPETVNIKEIIEIIVLMQEAQAKEKTIKIKPLHNDLIVKADKNLIKDFLNALTDRLVQNKSSVSFKSDQKNQSLILELNQKPTKIKSIDPITCLKQKKLPTDEISFQIILAIVEKTGIKIKSEGRKITIQFNKITEL